jgi:hypothetical protein
VVRMPQDNTAGSIAYHIVLGLGGLAIGLGILALSLSGMASGLRGGGAMSTVARLSIVTMLGILAAIWAIIMALW